MAESTATIKLRAVDTNVVSTINGVSQASTNALLGATALAGGFKLLSKASDTNVASMALGANNAAVLTEQFGKLSNASNIVTKSLGKISTAAFYTQQLAIAADGVGQAAEKYARLPQAMQAMQASGVSTYSIKQFNDLTEAVKGSDIALDSLLVSSIAELGEFEKAAARAGTILKSSLRFDESGNALTANAKERLDNALSVQKLVNGELNNSVSSTQALQGQYEVLSSGFTQIKESQEVLLQGSKLISIGQTGGRAVDTTATMQLLTKSLNAYGYEAEDAAKVSAKLNAIVENGLTTIPELSQGFGKMAAQASKANIALDDSGAAVAVLTSQGISTAESMSGIARLSASIISKTPEAEKELAKLQLRGEKIRFDKAEIQAKGLTQALIDLNDATGGSSAILSKILPEDVAFRTANALLAENGKRLAETKQKLVAADEAKLNEIFQVSQSDNSSRFLRLANRFKESIIEIGISLAPTLEPGIKALETIANQFASLPDPVRKAIGSYLAFRIQSKAVGSAAGVLIKTLAGLATNYLTVRLLSLALTGQLGKEAKVVKDLVLQKQGLASATLHAMGIDQRWRLEQNAATQAIAKQTKVAKAAAAVKVKASNAAASAASAARSAGVAGVAATSGLTKEQVLAELKKRQVQAINIAQAGTAKAKQYAQQFAQRFGFYQGTQTVDTQATAPIAGYLPPAGGARTAAAPRIAGYLPPAGAVPTTPPPVPRPTAQVSALNNLIGRDKAVVAASAKRAATTAKYDKLFIEKEKLRAKISKASNASSKAEIALQKAKNEALTATTNKAEALNKVALKKQQLTQANNTLALTEHKLRSLNTEGMVLKNRLQLQENNLDQARLVAKAKYAPLAKAIAASQKAEALATQAATTAKIAKLKADETEIAYGARSKVTLLAKRDAYLANIAATNASKLATQKNLAVKELESKLTLKQTLAEQGLYQARIFGNTVTLKNVGLMGNINRLLTVNLLTTKAAVIAETAYAKAKAGVVAISNIRNIQIGVEEIKLAALNAKSIAGGFFNLLSSGASSAGSAIKGLLSPLGALAPILGVGAIATIALRSEIFGLGKDVRKLSKEYKQLLKEQEKLSINVQKRSGLTQIEGLLGDNNLSEANKTLISLNDSGALTSEEFKRLSNAFDKAADSSNKTKDNLIDLQAEIKKTKAGAVEAEKGIFNSLVDGIKKTPALIGKGLDQGLNTQAAILNQIPNLILGKGFTTTADVQIDREADKITETLGVLGNAQASAGKRTFDTTVAIKEYKDNLALTSIAQEKVAKGIKLSSADIKNEEETFKAKNDLNRQQIEILEKQISTAQDIAAKTKDEGNKQLINNQIQLSIKHKNSLEAESEALKKLYEESKKYLQTTLPSIQLALKENADPAQALANAQQKFDQAFLTDGEGNITKFFKPIETLRDESFKLVNQIQENLSVGLFDQVGEGEAIAAAKIRQIRDNELSTVINGEIVKGYRLQLGQRRELTSAIISLENADLKRAETKNKIEIDLAKSLSQARLESTTTTNVKIAQLQAKAIEDRITQKVNEINELKKLGLRTIDQEIQLEQLRIQQQSSVYAIEAARIQKQQADRKLINQERQLDNQRFLADSKKIINILSQENAIASSSLQQNKQKLQTTNRIVQISNSISQNDVYNSEIQQRLAKFKLANLKTSIPLERSQLENQITITAENQKQQIINARLSKAKAETSLTEAQETLRIAQRNGASTEQLRNLQLEVNSRKLAVEQAQEAINKTEFQLYQGDRLAEQKRSQFETNKQLENSALKITHSSAKLAENNAQITREYSQQNQALNNRIATIKTAAKQSNFILDNRTSELQLIQKVTSSEKLKLNLAQQTSVLKLKSLKAQIGSEAEILALNQQQARLKLKAEKDKTGAGLQQNLADVLKLQANIEKLQASGASRGEINAEKAQLNATFAQRQVLIDNQNRQREQEKLLLQSQRFERDSFRSSSRLKVDAARADAIGALPEEKRSRAQKKLFNEFKSRGQVNFNNPNLQGTIDSLRSFTVKVPDLKVPKLDFPSIEDIKKDVRSIVSEFRVTPPNTSAFLNAQEGEGKRFVIQNLSMDSPININIDGAQDKEEIAQQVESTVFSTMTDVMRGVEEELNNFN